MLFRKHRSIQSTALWRCFLFAFFLPTAAFAQSGGQRPNRPQTGISVHDPVLIQQDSTYYLFCTGRGISVWSSKDAKSWQREKPVFDSLPWGVQAVKGFRDHIWAPDISYHDGLYYLFYSVSTFGKNASCIGMATNKTLHPSSPDFKWVDHGKVIESTPGRDMWNAIDPNIIWDDNNQPWMAFGSFWNGLKLVKLSKDLTTVDTPQQWHSIASRKLNYHAPDSTAGDGAIEAPFIVKRNGYYYLFASTDLCCKGPQSTYKMIVGRAERLTGPYIDKNGIPLIKSGGTILLQGDKDWYGVGHNAVYPIDGTDCLIFHGYDVKDNGRPKLRIEKLQWVNGWPEIATTK